jgi:ribose transport system permease protein
MENQVKTNTDQKEQQLKKISKMSMIRALLPIAGLIIIFLLFNVLTNFRMMKNLPLVLSQVYVTMIAATGVFFIMTMGGLDFSQGSILGIASIVVCMLSKTSIPLAIVGGIVAGAVIGAINGIPQDQILYCYDLYHVPVPWIYQVSDHQRAGRRFCKADQL